ncbi:hypothetical protein [Paenarthrobacter sp. NCHU4564]|uniref:hypothetical protein n=1 Tax=Paenarthrobacter sp. NCHU4564 TaxID=3451353 RepID=UPI003F9E8A1E
MTRKALFGAGASALLVLALTACSSGSGTSSTATSSPSETATPTPTVAKQYTNDELMELVKQIKTADGADLTVMSSEDLAQENPMKALLSMMTIEPAECADLATLGGSEPLPGSTTAAGADVTSGAAGVMSVVTLTSGVDADALTKSVEDSSAHAAKCATMTLTMAGQSLTVATEKVDGISKVPGTVGYKTAMSLPDGQKQSTYMAFAIKDGVLISATASGKTAETEGAAAAGALMDQAAALIK